MKCEKFWHCPVCHFMDCSNGENTDGRHQSYRGIDIGSCKGVLERLYKKEVD